MKTSPVISFGLYALTIKQDSSPECSDVQTFSKVSDLKTGNVINRPYITYEPNFWLLDGGYKFKPTNDAVVHVGLMSLSMSNASGVFAVPPVLTVYFSDTHDTDGITLKFAQYSVDYAASFNIAYYDASDVLIRFDSYSPSGTEFSTEQTVENFKKIVITFNSTNKPYRYLRVMGVDFGKLTHFTGADIKSAVVVEQVNPLSIELPVNTLELNLYSSNETFSIINPTGEYSSLQNKQPLDVYEIVGNEQIYIGQFFLDTWENPSNTEVLFRAFDGIGVLDTIPCMGGIWTTPVTAETLLTDLFTAIGTPFDLDTDLYSEEIVGWIPACSYREALQQIAFAIGAYVTCARSGIIQIRKTNIASDLSAFDYTIGKSNKGMNNQSLTLKTLVTGVEISAHNYVSNSDVTELYNGSLAVGERKIVFNAPMHDLSISGATIIESGANYAIVNVTVAGVVVLSGQGYTDTKQESSIYNNTLDKNVKKNILSITNATLINSSNVTAINQRVYDYYQQRYFQKVKLFVPDAETGASVLIDAPNNTTIGGIVEKMTLDLSGGFVAQAEITGVITE